MSMGWRKPSFCVTHWDVTREMDAIWSLSSSRLTLEAEVVCRGESGHFPRPSEDDIAKAFALLLGADPEQVEVV